MKGLAVFFPGIGYTLDKPLLHYSRRLAEQQGYEIRLLSYTDFPKKVKGDRQKMAEACRLACGQAADMLKDVDFDDYEELLFVGKSIGTVVAVRLAEERGILSQVRFLLYTPLEETFALPFRSALVFTGSADPWVGGADSRIAALCGEHASACIVIEGANHSLESPDPLADIANLQTIMRGSARYIKGE